MNKTFTCTKKEEVLLLGKGFYQLFLFGAEGGSFEDVNYQSKAGNGGKGGFTYGVLELKKQSTLYINVGCKGTQSPNSVWNPGEHHLLEGGFNGGGDCWTQCGSGTGGGASDIRLNTNDLIDRIIVAGGGGGAGFAGKGGDGGDIHAEDGSFYMTVKGERALGMGGTDKFGGKIKDYSSNEIINDPRYVKNNYTNTFGEFGIGGLGMNCGGGGGGGGYYGGGGSYNGGAGGGGSSYINKMIRNGRMTKGQHSGDDLIIIQKFFSNFLFKE